MNIDDILWYTLGPICIGALIIGAAMAFWESYLNILQVVIILAWLWSVGAILMLVGYAVSERVME